MPEVQASPDTVKKKKDWSGIFADVPVVQLEEKMAAVDTDPDVQTPCISPAPP